MKKIQPDKKQELSEQEMKAVVGGVVVARKKAPRKLKTVVELTDAELNVVTGGAGPKRVAPRKKR